MTAFEGKRFFYARNYRTTDWRKQTMKESNAGLKDYPDVMDITQVSRFLGISTKTGYAILRNGGIAYLKVGRSYRIPKSSLKRYMKTAKTH
jgi:excisionase family DNA binding protein